MISLYDVEDFLKKLNAREKFHYRLPTEHEWEFAALGNRPDLSMAEIQDYAWCYENSDKKPIH